MNIEKIYKSIENICISNYLDRDGSYLFNKVCREYSKTYHTPLHMVYELPLIDVITAFLEERLDNMEFNHIYDLFMKNHMPEEFKEEEEEDEEFAKQMHEWALSRNKKKEEKIEKESPPLNASMTFDIKD